MYFQNKMIHTKSISNHRNRYICEITIIVFQEMDLSIYYRTNTSSMDVFKMKYIQLQFMLIEITIMKIYFPRNNINSIYFS